MTLQNVRKIKGTADKDGLKNITCNGVFTLPDTDTDLDTDNNWFNSNLCRNRCLAV